MDLRIHSVESLGTVDGPGIRFVIFTQGCPLRCQYCHNPDTWDPKLGKKVDVDEIINQIKDFQMFFKKGGVTVSGGEPLLQIKQLTYLFRKLKEIGIHTCIDTSGYINITDNLKELLEYVDLVLLDIKVLDDNKHKDLTSVSNEKTLEFARYLDSINKPVWIRHVLVPTINDKDNDLKQLKEFVDTLSNVEKIELLPYHELGTYKWEELGLEYKLSHVSPPSDNLIRKAKEILNIE